MNTLSEQSKVTITKSVTVCEAPPYTRANFQATLKDWDGGVPIGYGKTIQEAIENFLEDWELKYDEQLNYKWS